LAKLLVSAAVQQLPLSNRFSTPYIIKSPISPASMPFVVATQLMISLSQQSSANATLTRSPLLHDGSNPSEHQRVSLSLTATVPSCFLVSKGF
jgi:hypothetical protein